MQHANLTFDSLGIAPKLLGILEHLKFVSPTPIQHKAIPLGIEGKDIVGIAQTGTGKTLAFGIPMVQRLASMPAARALVLVPTRELAFQVEEALRKICHPFSIASAVVIGGASMHNQIQALRKQPRVIIATPGRLMDHLRQGTVNLKEVKILVIDEADRMFDMGFAPQVAQILGRISRDRQTLLFSATMPDNIVRLATEQMKLPIHVEMAPPGTTAERVTQELFIIQEEAKKDLLQKLLTERRGSVLLFTRTKIRARKVTRLLRDGGHEAAEIHSDRTMAQRMQAMEGFKCGRYRILVATDIASRGIDVKNISLVINYDLPEDVENYVHRIGRTARAEAAGHAITFATPDQGSTVRDIERLIRTPLAIAKHPEVASTAFVRPAMRSFSPRRRFGRRR